MEIATATAWQLDALSSFSDKRLPELFAGYPAYPFRIPVDYPAANRPQAWSSGAVIYMVRSILGLEIDALRRTVSAEPLVIPGMTYLKMRRMPMGGGLAEVTLRVSGVRASVSFDKLPPGFRVVGRKKAA